MRTSTLCLVLALAASCSKKPAEPDTTTPEPTTTDPVTTPAGDEGKAERPALSAADCEAQGGKVVGDIGDGAIHKPDYKCEGSGEAPIGSIAPDPGGPTAIEGAVCCK